MRGTVGVRVVIGTLAVSLFSGGVVAHVDYVTDETEPGSFSELIEAVVSSPLSLALLGAGTVGGLVLVVGYLRFASQIKDIEVARRTMASYRPYLPWMLRLSVGLPLVGAGFAGYLFSPSVQVNARLLQVGIGFLLLFGLATRVVAVVGVLAYGLALPQHFPTLLLNSELVGGCLAIALVGAGQPSADMLIRRLMVTDGTIASRFRSAPSPQELVGRLGLGPDMAPVVVRVFMGINFVYLGISQKWLEPGQAAAVVAKYDLTSIVPVSPELWIFGAGLVEASVGLLFLTGTFTRGAAAAGFVLLTTTLFGLPDDPVVAHISLFGLTSVLLVTGGGRYSLDTSVIPALRRRLDPTTDSTGTAAD